MNYPKEFVEKVKKVYPNWKRLHEALDAGSYMVGRYLCDSTCDSVSLEKILDADNIEDLKETAKLASERNSVYTEWCKLYDIQVPKIG